MDPSEAKIRNGLALGAFVAIVGVALSLVTGSALGGLFTVAGTALLVLSVHRFGRTGPS